MIGLTKMDAVIGSRNFELREKVSEDQAADETSLSRPTAKVTPVSDLSKRCFVSVARDRFLAAIMSLNAVGNAVFRERQLLERLV